MGRVLTNNIGINYAIEDTENNLDNIGLLAGEPAPAGGTISGTPEWFEVEPNSVASIGSTITTVPRNPISRNRQNRKGSVTDLDSAFEVETDLTLSAFKDFAEGFTFSRFRGATELQPSAVTSTAYTVSGAPVLEEGTLVLARGFNTTANNGLKVVGASASATSVPVTGLTAETSPPSNVTLEVAGFRTAAGDLDVTAVSNNVVTITSSANVFNSNGLDLLPGIALYFGGASASNSFSTANNSGYARVVSVASDGSQITIDTTGQTWAIESNSAQEVDFYIGRFLRTVAVDATDFLERSFQFEFSSPNLFNNNATGYEYSRGNYCNTLAVNLPLTDKATITPAFIGTDTDVPTSTRKTGASTALAPTQTEAINTTQDCARLRIANIDETGLTTDFKSLTVTLTNNVSPEKVLCNLGARFMNYGNFEVTIESDILFTNPNVINAIRNNETVSMTFAVQNTDGAIFFHVPSMTLGDGARDLPLNESVQISLTGTAFIDPTLQTSIGITVFPFIPS